MSLAPEIRSFIARYIDDLEALDLVLLLHRKRATSWSAEEAAQELGLDAIRVGDRLAYLVAIGLVTSETGERFTWSPRTGEVASIVDRIAEAWRTDRRLLLDEVGGPNPLKSFSEAFRFRERKDEDG